MYCVYSLNKNNYVEHYIIDTTLEKLHNITSLPKPAVYAKLK